MIVLFQEDESNPEIVDVMWFSKLFIDILLAWLPAWTSHDAHLVPSFLSYASNDMLDHYHQDETGFGDVSPLYSLFPNVDSPEEPVPAHKEQM